MLDLYPRNTAGMWASLAARCPGGVVVAADDEFAAARPTAYAPLRGVLLAPGRPASIVAARITAARLPEVLTVVEDPFGTVDLEPHGFAVRRGGRMTVMVRPAGPIRCLHKAEVEVSVAADQDALETAERVIVEGFPVASALPFVAGQTLPSDVLSMPGWRVYLARFRGVPAGAGYTWCDDEAAGVYWLATLPAYRGRGIARAVISRMIADLPELPITLTASALGAPLYHSLDFQTVSNAIWWVPAGEAAVWIT